MSAACKDRLLSNSLEDLEIGLDFCGAEYSPDSGLGACVDGNSFPDILTSVVLSTKFNGNIVSLLNILIALFFFSQFQTLFVCFPVSHK